MSDPCYSHRAGSFVGWALPSMLILGVKSSILSMQLIRSRNSELSELIQIVEIWNLHEPSRPKKAQN
jgi:hypothetical protein